MGCKPDIQRKQHRARLQNTVIRLQESMAVEAEKRDPVAGLHSCFT